MSYKLENLERAADLETRERWAELLDFAKSWATEEPNNLFAWQAVGDSLRKLGRLPEAIPAFLKGLEVAPPKPVEFFGRLLSSGPLWYRLANAFNDTGRLQEAIDAFHKASEADPLVTAIWNDLGVTYTKANDYKGAFAAFKKAVSIDATNTNSLKNLGIVYAMCGVEEGVQQVHRMLSQLDSSVAQEFITNAKKVLSER